MSYSSGGKPITHVPQQTYRSLCGHTSQVTPASPKQLKTDHSARQGHTQKGVAVPGNDVTSQDIICNSSAGQYSDLIVVLTIFDILSGFWVAVWTLVSNRFTTTVRELLRET